MSLGMCVSVIIPVYNAGKFLDKAVKSALEQPVVEEVILVEDGSTDDSFEICTRLRDECSKVKLYQHADKKNKGASASRNLGMGKASLPFIAFLDADDFYRPGRFSADLEVFNKYPDADGVYNAVGPYFCDGGDEAVYRKTYPDLLHTVKRKVNPSQVFPGLISMIDRFGFIHLNGLTIKKSLPEKMDACFLVDLFPYEDTEFLIRMAYYGRLYPGRIDEPVALRTVHDANSIFKNRDRKRRSAFLHHMWSELYSWAEKENIPEPWMHHFRRMQSSTRIATRPYFPAWAAFIRAVSNDRDFFFRKIYYNTIHYRLFGEGLSGQLMLKVKNQIQRFLKVSFTFEQDFYE